MPSRWSAQSAADVACWILLVVAPVAIMLANSRSFAAYASLVAMQCGLTGGSTILWPCKSRLRPSWWFVTVIYLVAAYATPAMLIVRDGISLSVWPASLAAFTTVVGTLVAVSARAWRADREGLVTDGPYAISRHPVALGKVVAFFGTSCFAISVEALAVIAVHVVVICVSARAVDSRLARKWGKDFEKWSSSTPVI